MFGVKLKTTIAGSKDLNKQTTFAVASALTLTAKEIQTATVKALDKSEGGAFEIRTNWNKPSNVFGVRIKPATKQNLTAVVGTAADWLEKFVREREGSIVLKLPRHGNFVAIPTSNVRRTKRDIIRASQRPAALRGKSDVVLPLRSGKGFVLFQGKPSGVRGVRKSTARGQSGRLVALYILVPQARIREKDVLFGPAKRVFERRFVDIYEQQLRKALAPRSP
jgi:hypothetical protein